jgi:hypothetical protein
MELCKYKDIFGAPNTSAHFYRLTFNGITQDSKGLAFIDLLFTLIGAIILSFYFKKIHWFTMFIILIILGVLFHLLFCVKTPITSIIV